MAIPNQLTVEWIDPRGKIWDLSGGTEGVRLAEGQSKLGLSPISHSLTGTGNYIGTVRNPAQPDLAVEVGVGLSGQEYYDLASDWWEWGASAQNPGILRFIQPNGEMREGWFRLREAPDVSYRFDPGMAGIENPVEPFLLQGISPWWSGAEQVLAYSRGEITRYEKFYGSTGSWPLHITPLSMVGTSWFRNTAPGPMYPSWELTGPLTNPKIAYDDKVCSYVGTIPAGQTVRVITTPGQVSAVNLATRVNVIGSIRLPSFGKFPAVPVGEAVKITIDAGSGATPQSRIIIRAREQHARPF